jgi:hypothetical protein
MFMSTGTVAWCSSGIFDHRKVMKGRETRRLLKLIAGLEKEQLP